MNQNRSMPATAIQPSLTWSYENSKDAKKLPNWANPALYKTRMCDHYKKKGECKFGTKCWYAHGREELRSVPRLTDRHPTATLEAINQVIECLPVSRSRDVAMSKGQQLYQQLVMQKGDSVELFGLQPEFVSPHNGQMVPQNFFYYPMVHPVFQPPHYTIVSNPGQIRYYSF